MTISALLSLFLLSLIFPGPTHAHAFGQLYNLPVPFWLYLYGAAAAIITSFLVVGFFVNKKDGILVYPELNISKHLPFLIGQLFVNTLKVIAVILFLAVLAGGFVGVNNPRQNFNMTFFWVVFTLGFSYLIAIFGNIWAITNPINSLFEAFEALAKKNLEGIFKYPKKLYYWPALLFYFLFIWIELFGQTTPRSLSTILSAYTLINVIGTILWGKVAWFKYCEFFSVYFKVVGKISPLTIQGNKLYLHPPLVRLLKSQAEHFSLVMFILFMLSSTAYDGFKSTGYWIKFSRIILEPVASLVFSNNPYLALQTAQTLGLLISPFLFLYIYLVLVATAQFITHNKTAIKKRTLEFAFSLVPIAFVYNVAHYWTLIVTEGQNIIRLVSDPFGFGWNLLSTAKYQTNYSFINANLGWHSQVALIIAGHIAGVYLAHVIAIRVYPNQKQALLSQFPMLALMVAYTIIGLWILAQPIVKDMTL